MKRLILLLLIGIFTAALVTALGANDKVWNENEPAGTNENIIDTSAFFPLIPVPDVPVPDVALPKSLDNLFPPKADRPVWLIGMLAQGTYFASIAADLSENDLENARDDFKKFKAQYKNNSKLVPEWEGFFLMYPADSLEAALKTGDRNKIMAAYGNMGQVCENCHSVNMPKVQMKYHWRTLDGKKFEEISVHLANESISFSRLMQLIDANFVGVGADIGQNQIENARLRFNEFNMTFQAMKGTCGNCHTSKREYYIDEDVQARIDTLGQALSESPVDSNKVGKLSQEIGEESCFKCHLVHVPAALAQKREEIER
ncbi:MAG: cytochrome c [Candidatus Methanoperedens sp.]|nr:cytochrome c [Candidatus Methanoperedens sp.]